MKRFSIIQPRMDECFLCRKMFHICSPYGLHKHEVFFGTDNRKKSIEYGMVVALCNYHHTDSVFAVHQGAKKEDMLLKQTAQKVFEKKYGHEKFMETFHHNYLEDEGVGEEC